MQQVEKICLCDYSLSLKLKELGFNTKCLCIHEPWGKKWRTIPRQKAKLIGEYIEAPLLTTAHNFLYKKSGINVIVRDDDVNGFYWVLSKNGDFIQSSERYKDWNDALEKGLLCIIDNYI